MAQLKKSTHSLFWFMLFIYRAQQCESIERFYNPRKKRTAHTSDLVSVTKSLREIHILQADTTILLSENKFISARSSACERESHTGTKQRRKIPRKSNHSKRKTKLEFQAEASSAQISVLCFP